MSTPLPPAAPAGLRVHSLAAGQTLEAMLEAGDIAGATAATKAALIDGGGGGTDAADGLPLPSFSSGSACLTITRTNKR